jgi:hypothetical protein
MARNRGTNILATIGKSIFESVSGRIRWRSNMWALVGSQWDKRRIKSLAGEIVRADHVLVKKQSTHCPSPPGSDFYYDGKWWWVPAVACRACQWHGPSGRGGFRFPRCTFQRVKEKATAEVATALVTLSMVKKAEEMALEIVKGKL